MDAQATQDTNLSTPGDNVHRAFEDSSGPDLFLSQYPGCGGDDTQLPELDSQEEELPPEGSKDEVVARLRAEIEELTKGSGNKGAVRKPPLFEADHGKAGTSVKTRSVTDVGKGTKPSPLNTRNKSKLEKVRTRADGPSETVEGLGEGSKKLKKKKVTTPNNEFTEVKRTSKK